jgi:hypothetical protein
MYAKFKFNLLVHKYYLLVMRNFTVYLNQDENIALSSTRYKSYVILNGMKRYPLNTVTLILLFLIVNNI